MKQLQVRKINQFFNTFVRSERDKEKSNYDASLAIELTSPETIGGVGRNANGVNLTVQLIQKTFSTDQIQLVASLAKVYRLSLLTLFFRADAQERGEKYRGAVVIFKNKKGQRDYMTVPKYPYISEKEREVNEKVMSRLGFGRKNDIEKSKNKNAIYSLIEKISNDLCYHAMIQAEDREALQTMTGVKVEEVMEYSHSIMFTPKFIKESKNSILFGWISFGTHASHPVTLKISKLKKGVKLVRLADFGAEYSGYYSHDSKYNCKPEHVQALRSFARSFKSLARKGV